MNCSEFKAVTALFLCLPWFVHAADIAVRALFPGRAIVQIDGGPPRTLTVGATTPEGVTLLDATAAEAVIEYEGRRETLTPGAGMRLGPAAPPAAGAGSVTLIRDGAGHFITTGTVNGASVRFLVDTGATLVILAAAEARRIGLDVSRGQRLMLQTANGSVAARRVTLDVVTVGAVTLYGVDAAVSDAPMPVQLLGMSFLNRTDLRREGDTLTLRRRY